MSEMFEAVVVVAPDPEALDLSSATNGFRTFRPATGVLVFLRTANRSKAFDLEAVEGLASLASAHSAKCVAAFYDNRVGHRYASSFSRGQLERQFDESDEIWVELDESGYPETDGPRIAAENLVPGIEYDCLGNAIDIALVEAGAPDGITCDGLKRMFFSSED